MSDKQKQKRELKPLLRFPEFREAGGWREEQLYKIAEPVSERATAGDGNSILTLSGEHGLVSQSEYFGKKIAGDNVERYIKIARNDFVYNDRTTKRSTYGSIKRLSQCETGIVSPIYKCFRFDADQNPSFWDWYFESGSHEAQLHGLINEGARAGRFNISIGRFLSTSVWLPDPPEQQKVADCLSSMDELITVEVQNLEVLKAHKKGLMQQLFPAEGEPVPRLRFPEFLDAPAWKEGRLSSHIHLESGLHLSPNEYGETGEVPYFTGPSDFTNNSSFITKRTDKSANTAIESDILITVKGSGVGELWHLTLPCVAMGRQLMAIRAKQCSSDFLYQILTTRRARFKALASGNLIPGLSRSDILDMKFHFPSHPEQQKIADCLSSIDELITTQSKKIDALNAHKKGLMQQLFPSMDEAHA
jgi:type I restriction enzyme S subunit